MIEMCRGLPNFADLICANPFLKGDDIYQNMQRWLFVYNSGNITTEQCNSMVTEILCQCSLEKKKFKKIRKQ